MAAVPETIDRARLFELTERERRRLLDRTPGSQAAFARAVAVMPRGVPSSFQAADPRPIYLSHG
jgi:glutamate-1-semialdehyde 2,1-aminomutase